MKKLLFLLISAVMTTVILVVIGISVGGCQEKPEKYTGPVEKLSIGIQDNFFPALVWVAKGKGTTMCFALPQQSGTNKGNNNGGDTNSSS